MTELKIKAHQHPEVSLVFVYIFSASKTIMKIINNWILKESNARYFKTQTNLKEM